jgi:hypothetical protein
VQIFWMDANLIRVAPECHDVGGPACPYRGALKQNVYSHIVAPLVEMRIFQSDRKKKTMNVSSLSDLCHSCRAASRHWLVEIPPSKKPETRTPFTIVCVMDRLSRCHATPGESMFLSYGLDIHSQ